MEITRESDFGAAKEVVQQLIDGLNKCDTTFKGTIIKKQDTIKNIAFSGFDDSVGQTFKTRITDLKTGEFKSLEDDFEGGGFKELEKNAKALLNEIQVCINSKAKIAQAEKEMDDAEYYDTVQIELPNGKKKDEKVLKRKQPAYNDAKAKKEEGEREFDNGVKYANVYIKEFPNIHFTGVKSNQDASADNSEKDSSQKTQKSKKDIVKENFDYEALRESMHDLFMWGVFSATIEYNGQYIYVKDISGGSGREFGFVDGRGQQIPGTPTFTKAQVSYADSYPAVEQAAINYFASH